MIEVITLQLMVRIASAIIALWLASIYIRRYGTFSPFLPILVYFMALAATAAAEFYEIFITNLQVIFDATFLVFYAWLFFVLLKIASAYHKDHR